MQPEVRKLLWDARDALEAVRSFLADKAYATFEADRLLRSGVEREFEIIGEALNQLAKLDPPTAELIPDLRRIVGFRNILAHAYADIDPELVWRIAMENAPRLRARLDELLGSERSS